jgi:hypothetical protein
MDSTQPKQSDDPHDVLELAPGVVLVAPADRADEEIPNLLRAAARQHSDPQTREEPNFAAGPAVPAVDTRFRAAAVDKVRAARGRPSTGGRAVRGLMGFLLAVCIGVAAAAWQSYGDAAEQMIADWSPQRVLASLLPTEQPALPAQPAPPAADAPGATSVQSAPDGGAPTAASAGEAPSLQSMARDLAAAGQQIEQLKASIEQLKASQEQMSRDLAKASEAKVSEVKASEQTPRPRISAPLPARPGAAAVRKPVASYRPSQAAAPYVPPPAAAPSYVPPRQAEPLPPPAIPPPVAPPPLDPELASVPRPPMPLRQ